MDGATNGSPPWPRISFSISAARRLSSDSTRSPSKGMVPMHRLGRKRRQADRDVFGAFWRAVADPFALPRHHRLPGAHFHDAALVLDMEGAVEDHGVFVEVGTLARLGPSGRAVHVRDAHLRLSGIDVADVLVHAIPSWHRHTPGRDCVCGD